MTQKIKELSEKLTSTEKTLLACTCLSIVVLTFSTVYMPKFREVRKARQNIMFLEDDIKGISTQVKFVQNRLDDNKSDTLGDKTESVIRDILDKGRLSNLLEDLDRLALRSGVKLAAIRPKEVREKQGYLEVIVRLEVDSSFKRLVSFLAMVEDIDMPINIIDLDIGSYSHESSEVRSNLYAKTFIKSTP